VLRFYSVLNTVTCKRIIQNKNAPIILYDTHFTFDKTQNIIITIIITTGFSPNLNARFLNLLTD
jgi:hypothetical protein